MNGRTSVLAIATAALLVGACGVPGGPSTAPPARLVLMTHDSFAISDEVMARFEQEHGVSVEVLKSGDAGSMVNQAILTRDAPLADVLYGVDNTFLSRALDAGIFDPHTSPAAGDISPSLTYGTQGLVTPIDYGDVCINYDKAAFEDEIPPGQLSELVDPSLKGKLVVENPATSSPGLAFLLATVVEFGEDGAYTWQDYWQGLRDNAVLVVEDWDTAYYSSFSGGSGEGDRPLVVSYATSPVAEVVFADPPITEAPTGVVARQCFRQVEYAGVLHGSKAPELARQFVDFMLSEDFQSDIPLNMYVFPASPNADVPDVFERYAAVVGDSAGLDPAQIAANRDRWVQEWTDVVLH
jgi:thiamine transport system substrate-binding protein